MVTAARFTPLSRTVLVYVAFVAFILTFMPFRFQTSGNFSNLWLLLPDDIVTNIFLFFPLGFLCKLSRRTPENPSCLQDLLCGLAFSLFIETSQLFIVGRFSQIGDVAANGTGAFLGAKACHATWMVVRERSVPRIMTLELPLVGSIYLLVPLLWTNSILSINQPSRLWLHLPMGLLGVTVFSSIYHFRLKGRARASLGRFTTLVACWFSFSSVPALMTRPAAMVALISFQAVVFAAMTRSSKRHDTRDRRFETSTAKKVLPLCAFCLVVSALWPCSGRAFGDFSGVHFLVLSTHFVDIFSALDFLETAMWLTLWSYLCTELRSRKSDPPGTVIAWILLVSLLGSLLVEMLRGYQAGSLFSVIECILLAAAALFGGAMYWMQLAAIRGWVKPGSGDDPPLSAR